MAQSRPKILSVLTIPTGGWTIRLNITNGAPYDTDVEFTMVAGDYFVAWDNQSDDFMHEFMSRAYSALELTSVANYDNGSSKGKPVLSIDSSHKVNIRCDQQMKVDWTASDGASVAAVLGFTSAAALTLSDSNQAGSYQHAYGWYSDDEDGQLEMLLNEDVSKATAMQAVHPAGGVSTQYISQRFTNVASLRWLLRDRTFSRDIGYTVAPLDPYDRNKGLECWWKEAREGSRFRVYRFNQLTNAVAEVSGTSTGGSTTTLADSGRSFSVEPFEHVGKVVRVTAWGSSTNLEMCFRIASHTSTTFTVSNSLFNETLHVGAYKVHDQRYQTYVIDLDQMKEFAPREIPNIDRYDIDLPLLRYVA